MIIDYVPTVRDKSLWIIEAKAPGVARDQAKHREQAWGYATHPEVNVPFFVLADGQRVAVYDLTRPDWDTPAVDIGSSELGTRFLELDNVTGARNVAKTVRRRVIRYLESALSTEVDYAAVDSTEREVRELLVRARSSIDQNREQIRAQERQSHAQLTARLDAGMGLAAVADEINVPRSLRGVDVDRAVDVVLSHPPSRRFSQLAGIFDVTAVNGMPRPFWPVRALQLAVALRVRGENGCDEAEIIARERIREALLGFPDDRVAAAAHRFERVLPITIARLLASDASGVDFNAQARELKAMMDAETQLRVPLDGPRLALGRIWSICRRIWERVEPWDEPTLQAYAAALEEIAVAVSFDETPFRSMVGQPFVGEAWQSRDPLAEHVVIFVADNDAADLVGEELSAVRTLIDAPGRAGPAAQQIVAAHSG